MFGKDKSKENDVPVTQTKSTSKEIKTLIGEGCRIEGNFFVPTATRIDGIIKGDLTGENGIVIGTKGRIEGNMNAPEIIVYGAVKGNIESEKLELKRGANVFGDVSVNNLITEAGAAFNGSCSMKTNTAGNVTELPQSQEVQSS